MPQLPYGDRVYQIPRCWNCATFTLAEKSARTPRKPAPSEAWRSQARSKAQCGFHLRCSSLWPPAVKCCLDKTLCALTAQLGWSDPTNYFGHGNVHKSGVAPAQSGVLSAPKIDRRDLRNLFGFGLFQKSEGELQGDGWGDLCLSCTVHPQKMCSHKRDPGKKSRRPLRV